MVLPAALSPTTKHIAMNFTILRGYPSTDLERAWREYLTQIECPSHYDAPEYFLEPLWAGRNPFAVLALEDNKIAGVLTGLHPDKHVMCGLPSRPQISVDPAADTEATLEALVKGLLEESSSAELVSVYSWRQLQLAPFPALGFQYRELPGNVVLDLTLGPDALFNQFSKDRRRNIRFAEKNGVEVSEALSAQDVADAYGVYSTWRQRRGKEAHGRTLSFELYEKAVSLKGNRRLFVARVSGKVVATNIFRFFPGGLFESSANTSLEEFIHLKPNDLLQWKGIEWACRNGLRRHSLGGSHQFLLRFGGTVVPILGYRLDRTWLRRHDLREKVENAGRRIVRKLPPAMEDGIRKLAGKQKGKG
jgi:hypothetical protein